MLFYPPGTQQGQAQQLQPPAATGRRAFSRPHPGIPFQATRGAMNNAIASGEQAGAVRMNAGNGISRGRGHQFLDGVRSGAARANAYSNAATIGNEDNFFNANAMADFRSSRADEDLSYRRLAEQRRVGEWDSRFQNLTSIWGALSGLLR